MKDNDELSASPESSYEHWEGWPAKIADKIAWGLMNDIFKADGLVRWSVKHRWLLNRMKPGPRVLEVEYGQKVKLRPGQTLTHYYARRCVHCVQHGKRAAIAGNTDRALMYWAMAETAAERLYGSWLHTIAAKEAARVRGVKRFGEDASGDSRALVNRALRSLPEAERYARGVPGIVAERTGISITQARKHISDLGYGAKNIKRGA